MKFIHTILSGMLCLLLLSCSSDEEQKAFHLQGTWMLESVSYWDEVVEQYDQEDYTRLRIYDDTCYYECEVMAAPSGKMFIPSGAEHYTLIERGPDDYLYLQSDETHPLTVRDDTTMVIQEMGRKYAWKVCHAYDDEAVAKIKGFVQSDLASGSEASHRYVFSYAERDLEASNHSLTYGLVLIAVAFLAAMNYMYIMYRKKKRIELELRRIEQEREALPEPVREALSNVEEQFHQTPFYLALRQKITRGEALSQEEWQQIEESFKSVYPRFNTTLLTLRNMSPLELQVCQLLKLGATPSEIATVLCKDKSSISTIRSRLYKKVFGTKGSSREWDDFILSL